MVEQLFWFRFFVGLYIVSTILYAIDVARGGEEGRAARRAEREEWKRQRAISVRRPILALQEVEKPRVRLHGYSR